MNIPNSLTIFRIILVPVVVILLMQGGFFMALMVFAIAGITDGLDGFLARALSQKTELGAYLDPLADKALLISSFMTLSVLGIIPGWLTVIVISRDCIILLGVSVLFFMSVPFEVKPAFVSKLTTVSQIATVIAALVMLSLPSLAQSVGEGLPAAEITGMKVLFWMTACFTVASGFTYIIRGARYINRTPPETT